MCRIQRVLCLTVESELVSVFFQRYFIFMYLRGFQI